MTYAKPVKRNRSAADKTRKEELRLYRQAQYRLAVERDRGLCVFCWFLDGRQVLASDVHHVYGRGRQAGDWREHHTQLVCTCRAHHPPPIREPGANPRLEWVEKVVERANRTPVNKSFKAPA